MTNDVIPITPKSRLFPTVPCKHIKKNVERSELTNSAPDAFLALLRPVSSRTEQVVVLGDELIGSHFGEHDVVLLW